MIRTRLLILGLSLVLAGCTHGVIRERTGPVTLDPVPSRPLSAALTLEAQGGLAREFEKLLTQSSYFSELTSQVSDRTDVEVTYLGTQCGSRKHMMDSFLGTWLVAMPATLLVTFPTLGMVPAINAGEWRCSHRFSYALRYQGQTQKRSFAREYDYVKYNTTFTHSLYTSPERVEYQNAYNADQAIAALLNAISAEYASMVRSTP